MTQAKVYAPQVPSELDHATRLWVPRVNLSPAKKFGTLVTMLPPQASRLGLVPIVEAIREQMKDFGPDDWVIAIGDPSIIAVCACIAFKKTGKIRLLKWDRQASEYIPMEITP